MFAARLPAQEKECLVAAHRAADGRAELVLPQRLRIGLAVAVAIDVVERVTRVENVVAHILVRGAVELVAAGFDADDHHRAGVAAKLGRIVAGLHFELGHCVE